MAQERSLEVKVGALILVSVFILGGFILMMGGLSLEKTYPIYVYFDNPGGLQSGAAVKMAGLKIGSVKELGFNTSHVNPKTGKSSLVKARANIEVKYRDIIRKDADFYVTSQGVLGEQFLAIDPGTGATPPLGENAEVDGIGPPRLDLFLAKSYELLDTTLAGLRNNRELLGDILTNTAGLLKGLNGTVTENRDRINRIVQNFESLSQEALTLTQNTRRNYVDNPKMLRTIDNVEHLSSEVRRDATPMLKDAKEAIANLNRISATVGDPKEIDKLRKTLEEVAQLASRANSIAGDTQSIVSHIKKGKGTVGALVMDEEMYDDMQEMVRDLKHNPWKFLWKE